MNKQYDLSTISLEYMNDEYDFRKSTQLMSHMRHAMKKIYVGYPDKSQTESLARSRFFGNRYHTLLEANSKAAEQPVPLLFLHGIRHIFTWSGTSSGIFMAVPVKY